MCQLPSLHFHDCRVWWEPSPSFYCSSVCGEKRGWVASVGDLIQSHDSTKCQRPYLKHSAVCEQGLESERNGIRSWVSLHVICVCSGLGSSNSLNYVFVFFHLEQGLANRAHCPFLIEVCWTQPYLDLLVCILPLATYMLQWQNWVGVTEII